jgi:hypothetical protein
VRFNRKNAINIKIRNNTICCFSETVFLSNIKENFFFNQIKENAGFKFNYILTGHRDSLKVSFKVDSCQ